MPCISQFFGISIWIYYDDHNPPHFHADYGDHAATFSIESGELLVGSLPASARRKVETWAQLHRQELQADWELSEKHQPLQQIPPLK